MADRLHMTFAERAELSQSPLAKRVFELMSQKESTLCAAIDDTDPQRVLQLAEAIGPHIAVLKTHVDTIEGYTGKVTVDLQNIAREQNFLIFEDRKFADIGQTVKNQYTKGLFHIIEWADIVNAHALPGPGIVDGIKDQVLTHDLLKQRGLLLLAQMSSKGNLLDAAYTEKVVAMAREYPDFVIGFIGAGVKSLPNLTKLAPPETIIFSPGVKLGTQPNTKGDSLGQQYSSPDDLVEAGADLLVVGRDIWGADKPVVQAKAYQAAGWAAYQQRISSSKT
jgi:orotidine 5'-phosphate decarboxylase subfamily 1